MATPRNPLESFIWGSGGRAMTPEQVAREREIAAALTDQGADFSPVGHWLQGAARLGHSAAGAFRNWRADEAETAGRGAFSDRWSSVFGGGASPVAEALASSVSPTALDAANAAGQAAPTTSSFSGGQQEFIDMLLPSALEVSAETGIDPRIIIAQAAQETGWGQSAPGNNFFGIKSHGQGGGQTLNTHEYINGERVNVSDSFRTFGSPEDSVRGYGEFIRSNPRYGDFMSAQGLDAQLEALQASGYATDPNYSQSVGSIARGIALPQQPQRVASADPSMTLEMTPEMNAAIGAANPADFIDARPNTATAPADPSVLARNLPFRPGQQQGATIPGVTDAPVTAAPQPSPGPVSQSGLPQSAAPGTVAQAGGFNPSIAELLALTGDPNFGYASPAQQQIIQSLIGQNLQEQAQARDPLRQLQLEREAIELEQMRAQMNAPAQAPYEIINGEVVWLDPTQQTAVSGGQFGSDSGFTLSPGQTRYGAGGEAIASLPAGTESLSENERQINALVERGFSRAEAEDLAYGFIQTVVDPVLESPMIVNRTTGEGRYITPAEAAIIEETFPAATGGLEQPAPAPIATDPVAGAFGALDGATDVPLQQQMDAARPTLWDITEGSTGIVPSLQEGWTNIAGQFGAGGFEDVVENRQMFDIEKNNLIRALSINPRFPVGEMERLEREINITPSAFNSANAMRARMIAINSALSTRLENELRSAADPNMPASARRNAIQAANDISNFLTTLGVPEGANAATGRGANDPAPENRPPLETFVRQ